MAKHNQQTEGWLDNVNDSHVSFPQGFVGEGTTHGPKFKNGAVNGQFQNGGKLTRYDDGGKTGDDETPAERRARVEALAKKLEEKAAKGEWYEAPESIKNTQWVKDRGGYAPTCIGGACEAMKEAGFIPESQWSNTEFSKKAKEYGFPNNGLGLQGIGNLERGDMFQLSQNVNEQGKYYPSHTMMNLGKDENGEYRLWDNNARTIITMPEERVERLLSPERTDREEHGRIYKLNPYNEVNPIGLTSDQLNDQATRNNIASDTVNDSNDYTWGIKPGAIDYNENTKFIMDHFVDFANNEDKIRKLAEVTGKPRSEIDDALLNVFGTLGQENAWTSAQGKGTKSKAKNLFESIVTSVGLGKGMSVGPGQLKYKGISEEDRERYNIESPRDLYDIDKVLPIMVGNDLKNRSVLQKWDEQGNFEPRFFGGQSGITTDTAQMTSMDSDNSLNTFSRFTPYLNNQYTSIRDKKIMEPGGKDWNPFTRGALISNEGDTYWDHLKVQHSGDKGSYAGNVAEGWMNNLIRKIKTDEDGNPLPEELSEVVVSRKQRADGGCISCGETMQNGGNIPGSVGFSYARTQDIPSNGPRAKKTKASAKDGKIIEDDRGQWAHPGKVTKINSGNITMKGVNYPVLGIDNLGNKKMMMPNKEYNFPGESVTEYPQMRKDGGYSKEIDQLHNFTNYNKPQKGGWLDSYK